jgi:hypothetical protein
MSADRIAAYTFYADQQRKLAAATIDDDQKREGHLSSAAKWLSMAEQSRDRSQGGHEAD